VIPRRLGKIAAVIAGALATAIPVVAIKLAVDAYVERQAANEVRLAAQRAVARAEWRIGQTVTALATIGARPLLSCGDVDLVAMQRIIMATTPIKDVVVADENGNPRCLTGWIKEHKLSRELRTADDRVFLSVVRQDEEGGHRVLRIRWHRSGDLLHLYASVPADLLLPDGVSGVAAGDPVVRVLLNEGTLIAAPFDRPESAADGVGMTAHNESSRYPLVVTATVSRAAALTEHADLRAFGTAAGIVLAMLVVAVGLFISWRERANPIVEMKRALRSKEFIPYYQPIVDIRSGMVLGCEVLIRWRRADGTIVSPASFIPLAESSGLIMPMTRALMVAVRDEFGAVLARHPRIKFSFNLTARHFENTAIVAEVKELFASSPVALSQLIFEITEREPLENLEMAKRVIEELQDLGCGIAIDDVGTGHGGLSYMLKLGANYLKIDKMFIDAIGSERYSTTIIETLVSLARSMRMRLCAEGVETMDQVRYLRERGIYVAQGYAFAAPLPGPLFRELLDAADPIGPEAKSGASGTVDGLAMAREHVAAA
jgi:sensor c-di-GMP phosphodiesterase-like protein